MKRRGRDDSRIVARVPVQLVLVSWLVLAIGTVDRLNAADITVAASQRFAKAGTREVPDFQKHVVPLLGRLGCNSAKCHGSFQGRGGFRLSLFGFDFESDRAALTAMSTSEEGARINSPAAANSLLVREPTEQTDHEGGKRFEIDGWEHRLLLRWIEAGAPGTSTPKKLVRIEVQPREIVLRQVDERSQLKVVAVWEDGLQEDVTCLCRFRTNNDAVIRVDSSGQAVATGRGDTHIVAFYDNGVTAVPVMLAQPGGPRPIKVRDHANRIDEFVAAKLAKLGLEPSSSCTDGAFLRRASIDITGSLPTPEEVESFLASPSADKRLRKIDELLGRPGYAAWWTNKLCDFTGCNPTAQTEVREVGQALAVQWYQWIHRRVVENRPYDQLVEGIVLSVGREPGQTSADYSEEMSSYVRRISPGDFSRRATMPHYWTRNSVKEPKQKALSFAHSFLGVQLQCAECHKHPFDRWTQQDFGDFTSFFENVRVTGGRVGFPQFAAARAGQTIRWPRLVIRNGEARTLQLLRSHEVEIAEGEDPRKPIMDWMRDKQNPWFARAFVNRVWASYFHAGIVDPPDAFTPANPPSHPELLKWLTREFVESEFDMKWLHRQITSSQTYQRSWKPNETNRHDRRNFSRSIPRRLPAEVVYDAVKQVTAASDKLQHVRNDLSRRATGFLSMRMAGTYAMNVFGKPARSLNCDCERASEPSLLQAVFLHNDPLVRMRLAESGWLEEIETTRSGQTAKDRTRLIRTAWLRTVGRPPAAAEISRAQQHLATAESVTEGIRDLLWALINTKEFVLNH